MSPAPPGVDPATEADFGAFVPGGRLRLAATGAGPLTGLDFVVKDLIDVAGDRKSVV